MKNKLMFMFAVTIFNASFTMAYIKKLFGFSTKEHPTQLEIYYKQVNELANIKKNMVETISATFVAFKKNVKDKRVRNLVSISRGSGGSDHSANFSLEGIKFEINEEDGVMHFSIKNIFDNSALIGEFTLDKKIYDNYAGELIYSHMVDVFDSIITYLSSNTREGFIKYLSDPKTAQEYPKTVANLKPVEQIEKSDSIERSLERLFAVMVHEGKLIKEKVEKIQQTNGKEELVENKD